MKKVIKTINVTEETYKKFQVICLLKSTSVSNEIDKFIKEQVEKNEK